MNQIRIGKRVLKNGMIKYRIEFWSENRGSFTITLDRKEEAENYKNKYQTQFYTNPTRFVMDMRRQRMSEKAKEALERIYENAQE